MRTTAGTDRRRKDGVWLESTVQQQAGTYPMTLNFHGREMDSRLHVTVGTRVSSPSAAKIHSRNHNPSQELRLP